MKLAEKLIGMFGEAKTIDTFEVKGKTYRIIDNLLTYELQVKTGSRYERVSYVKSKEDAMNVINGKPRNLRENGSTNVKSDDSLSATELKVLKELRLHVGETGAVESAPDGLARCNAVLKLAKRGIVEIISDTVDRVQFYKGRGKFSHTTTGTSRVVRFRALKNFKEYI
jgi:hypothetical protein